MSDFQIVRFRKAVNCLTPGGSRRFIPYWRHLRLNVGQIGLPLWISNPLRQRSSSDPWMEVVMVRPLVVVAGLFALFHPHALLAKDHHRERSAEQCTEDKSEA